MASARQRLAVAVGTGVALLSVLASASGSAADKQPAAGRTDPHANSPAGVIYQIPLDSGRRDAAPAAPAGGTGSGGGGTPSGSTPGAATGSGDPTPDGGADTTPAPSAGSPAATNAVAPGGGTAEDPSSIHSENGFGSSSHVPGVSDPGVPTLASAQVSDAGGGSSFGVYALLIAAGGVALMSGVGAAGRLRS
jgi:hypothetical protein